MEEREWKCFIDSKGEGPKCLHENAGEDQTDCRNIHVNDLTSGSV